MERADILRRLVQFDEPTVPLLVALRAYGWDWAEEEPLVRISAEHIIRMLDRFLRDEISADQLQEWAENLECREDVGFDVSGEDILDDVFFRIATPMINEPLTKKIVTGMRNELLIIVQK